MFDLEWMENDQPFITDTITQSMVVFAFHQRGKPANSHYKSSGLASNLPLPLRDSAHSHCWEEPEFGVAADASALPTQELYSYKLLALICAVVFIEVSDCCINSLRSAPRRCLCLLPPKMPALFCPNCSVSVIKHRDFSCHFG